MPGNSYSNRYDRNEEKYHENFWQIVNSGGIHIFDRVTELGEFVVNGRRSRCGRDHYDGPSDMYR